MSEDILTSPEAGGRVIRGSVLRVAGHLSGVVLMAAASVLLLRHLGVVDAGRYFTVMALVAVTGTLAEAGLNVVGSRELAVRPEAERSRLLGALLGLRALITPLGVGAAVGFALAAGYTDAMVIGTLLAGVGLILVSLQATVMLRLVVELRNGRLAIAELLKQVVTVAGIAALVAGGAALLPFFAVQIAVGVAIVVATPWLVGRGALIRPRFDRADLRWLVREALPIAAAFVLGALYFRIVILLMSVISPAYEVGLFGTSLRIMETLAGLPVLIAGTALPVLAAAARDDLARLRYALQRMTEVALAAGALAILVTAFAADEIVVLLGGEDYRPAGDVLRIQVVALLFIFLSQLWTTGLIALRRQRSLVWINGVALAFVLACAAVLVPMSDAIGGAWATVLGDALLAGLALWALHRAAPESGPRWGLAPRLLAPLALGASVALVPGLPALAAAALAGGVFVVAAWLLRAMPPELAGALRGRAPKL